MNPITIIIFEYIRHAQYLVYTSVYIPAIHIIYLRESVYTLRRPVHCVVVKARPPCVGGRDTWQTRPEDVAARSILLFSSSSLLFFSFSSGLPFILPCRSIAMKWTLIGRSRVWGGGVVWLRLSSSSSAVAVTASQHQWPSFAVLVVLCLRGISRRRRPRVVCPPLSSSPQESSFVYFAG